MTPIDAVLVGAGNRGRYTYGGYALANPDRLRIAAVAEPDPERRRAMVEEHGIAVDAVFDDWRALFDGPRRAPAAIVATGDTLHVEPALAALEAGYHVLLEKPIAPTAAECVRVVEAAEQCGRLLQIGHVLRFTRFYQQVHRVLESGRLGQLVAIDMKEHVAHWHMTHSYVRGKFRNREIAAPILLAKCCHDLDLLAWFADEPARRIVSLGSLSHYRADRAPAGAPERCSDGCPVQATCPHDAVHFYVDPDPKLARIWPWTDVSPDPSREARQRALETGPYGRCVYHCDNDMNDHQVVNVEFESGLTASFTVQGLATEERRTIRITGSRGELRGVFQDGVIEVSKHGSFEVERLEVSASAMDHYGGDPGLLDHFTDVLAREAYTESRTSGRISLESHLLGFAAERAREEARVVEMSAFRDEIAP
ncbi:MAG: Gfo/Idh/MocA family oxidoreductase [Proteobacteria bacterium]|nr:Gfo/Idh/MocA family oxidoreductase [Pseudomonadota bacterium]